MARDKRELFPVLLTPRPLEHENLMLKNGHTDAAINEDANLLNFGGTVCVRGQAVEGGAEPEAARAVVLRHAQLPNELPDDPDQLPANLKTFMKEGRVGNWVDADNNPYNFRFHRGDGGQNRDVGLCHDGHSHEKRKDNYLCLWLMFGGAWQAYETMQFAVIGKDENECGQSRV